MLNYESIIWLVFRAIDSLILIALATWLYMRKALPYFRNEIAVEQGERMSEQRSIEDLKLHAEQLDGQLIDDAHDIERLEQKVHLWQQAVKRKQVRDVVEKEDVLVRLHKLNEQRGHTVRHQMFYATALLEATDAAEQVLRQDAHTCVIVDEVVQFMVTHKEPV